MLSVPSSFIIDDLVVREMGMYMHTQENLLETDVYKDPKYRKNFCKYYGLNVFTNSVYQDKYFQYLQEHKRDENLSYEQVLSDLNEKTKRVDYSFASKLIHTIDKNQPLLDKHVMRLLGFAVKDSGKAAKRIEYYVDVHNTVRHEYDIVSKQLESGSYTPICSAIRAFDKAFPQYASFSVARKIDAILFRMKDGRGNSLLTI